MIPSDLLTTTIAQAIAWIVSVGIAGFVAYGVQYLPLNDTWKKVVNFVAVAMLTAGVTAIASFIPDSWLTMKLIDAAFALVTLLIATIGTVKLATFKAQTHLLEIRTKALKV